jgi:hypothetical protein
LRTISPAGDVQTGVEIGKAFEGRGRGLEGKDRQGQPAPLGRDGVAVFAAQGLQFGQVHHVLGVHVGNLRPGQGHLAGGGFADGAQPEAFGGAPLVEVRQRRGFRRAGSPAAAAVRGRLRPGIFGGKRLNVLGGHQPLGARGGHGVQVDPQLAGQAPGGRRGRQRRPLSYLSAV